MCCASGGTVASAMPDPAIEFREVSFARPDRPRVLDAFSLTVEAGEVLALVGRSGAGKSRLLKRSSRLHAPAGGAVVVEGRATRGWDRIQRRRRVGSVRQEVGLRPPTTSGENVGVLRQRARCARERTGARPE